MVLDQQDLMVTVLGMVQEVVMETSNAKEEIKSLRSREKEKPQNQRSLPRVQVLWEIDYGP